MSYLLDTNVISEIRRARDINVRAWAARIRDAELHLSVLTIGEIRKGIERLHARDPAQAEVFKQWLEQLVERFADRIISVDVRIAQQWGTLNAVTPHNTVDSLIAATAFVHDLTVVTRNTGDFEGCGVRLLTPGSPLPLDLVREPKQRRDDQSASATKQAPAEPARPSRLPRFGHQPVANAVAENVETTA